MNAALWVAGTLLAVLLLLFAVSCLIRANRLDRLHVRTDAALAALMAALERRAVVARAVAVALDDESLRRVAADAELASEAEREAAENDLSQLLAALDRRPPPALAEEVADADVRVMLARQVYNDAVRDTLALRSRRLVRWLRLAGTAPSPGYFEIVDGGATGGDGGEGVVPPRRRRAGRVLLLDPSGRLLLFEGTDPAHPHESYWFTPGGGVHPNEDTRTAAARELTEETGLWIAPDELQGPVFRRRALFSFAGGNLEADEEFFVAHTDGQRVDNSGFSALERNTVLGHRWWTCDELRVTDEIVYPRELADLLAELSDRDSDPDPRRGSAG